MRFYHYSSEQAYIDAGEPFGPIDESEEMPLVLRLFADLHRWLFHEAA
jgi:hypothetical protein